MPLSDPAPRKALHTRQITIDAFEREDGMIDLEATLVDSKPTALSLSADRPHLEPGEPIHQITLRLTVDGESVIRATEVAMDATPYSYCREVPEHFDLNGLRIGPGFTKAVRERIGPSHNCWHAQQMLPQIATTLVQATFPANRVRLHQLPPSERPAPPMLNTCVGWQSHRVHVRIEHPDHYTGPDRQA